MITRTCVLFFSTASRIASIYGIESASEQNPGVNKCIRQYISSEKLAVIIPIESVDAARLAAVKGKILGDRFVAEGFRVLP